MQYPAYLLVRLILGVFRVLPRSAGIVIIRMLAGCVYYCDFRHKRIAAVNLRIAFPRLSEKERRRIARRSFQNTAMNLLEIGRLAPLNDANIASLVEYDKDAGLNNYLEAHSRGKGIIYLTGHFSAWELLPIAHSLYGHPLSFITRPLDNAALERYLQKMRESKGNKAINRRNSSRLILRALSCNGDVGILMDHNTTFHEGIFVDFFGIPAMTTTSIARFALHTGCAVVPVYLTPMHRGRYTMKFHPHIKLVWTGDLDRDIEANTRIFNEILEKIIRQQPESWMWGHKRWKNQPPGNPPDIYRLSGEELDRFLKERQGPGTVSPGAE